MSTPFVLSLSKHERPSPFDRAALRRSGRTVSALCLLAFASVAGAAESYPTRPIRLVVPYPPGGNVDITARTVGTPLGEALGQSVVIDNRSGAGGSTGAHLVARAPADGYTLLMGSSAPLSINTIVLKDIPYDAVRDFAPVSLVQTVTLVVLASPKSPTSSIQDLIARMKANPGKVTMATPGTGTTNHLALELFASMTGVRPLHVPYKGSGPALSELLGGQVETMVDQLTSSIGHVRDGRLKVLATTGRRRAQMLPSVPTLDESGLKGYEASTFIGVVAPAGIPAAVMKRLNDATRKVMAMPEVIERFRALGTEPGASSPEEFRKTIVDELGKWRGVVRKANLKFD